MKVKLTRPQIWTIVVMSMFVAFVLLANFMFEFKKISSGKRATKIVPSLLQEEGGESSERIVSRRFTPKVGSSGRSRRGVRSRQRGGGRTTTDPLKYGTFTYIKKDGTKLTQQEAQALAESRRKQLLAQETPLGSLLAQRVEGIISNFDPQMQEKINGAIENPTLIPQVIAYTDEQIKACNTALAENENNLEATTKKEHLAVLKSILVSTLNE